MRQHSRSIASAFVLAALLLALPTFAADGKAEAKAEGKRVVNINTADAFQLGYLPRVGPSLAQKIVDHRKKTPFKSAEDLMLVPGIGEKTFQLLRPYLTVSGETTLKEKVHGAKTAKPKEGSR